MGEPVLQPSGSWTGGCSSCTSIRRAQQPVRVIISGKTIRVLCLDPRRGDLIAMFSEWIFYPFRQGASPLRYQTPSSLRILQLRNSCRARPLKLNGYRSSTLIRNRLASAFLFLASTSQSMLPNLRESSDHGDILSRPVEGRLWIGRHVNTFSNQGDGNVNCC